MAKKLSLSRHLSEAKSDRKFGKSEFKEEIEKLQLKVLRIQQGIWHKKSRAIIVFEGFDGAGKGGAIRRLTRILDPRGVRVHSIGPPAPEEQGKHWLYRFWTNLPAPGTIAIFDRSWYGRVLVERVEDLSSKDQWKRAYSEINQFEKMLQDDGVEIVKIFLAISKGEQLRRFEERLRDPYKQWKLSMDDLRARKKWDEYVVAMDEALARTSPRQSPWHLISADYKPFARKETLRIVTSTLRSCEAWMEKQAGRLGKRSLGAALRKLGKQKDDLCP